MSQQSPAPEEQSPPPTEPPVPKSESEAARAAGAAEGELVKSPSKGSKGGSLVRPTSGGSKAAAGGSKVPTEAPPPEKEVCDLTIEQACEPKCCCPKAKERAAANENRKHRALKDLFGEMPELQLENRCSFFKPLEECCHNPLYCSHITYNRYAYDKAMYARNQYPQVTTYQTDYKPFKTAEPDNDVRIMCLIRGWGLGPDFLHHAHLDSISSPEPYQRYFGAYDGSDCCPKKNILDEHRFKRRRPWAGDACSQQILPDYSAINPGYRRKFTLLGENPEIAMFPNTYNHDYSNRCRPNEFSHLSNNYCYSAPCPGTGRYSVKTGPYRFDNYHRM